MTTTKLADADAGATAHETRLPPVSPFDAAILRHLSDHLEGEAAVLGTYRRLAASADAPVRYLAQLVVEDEERHHRVITELANKFRSGNAVADGTPHVPWLVRQSDRDELRRSIRRLRRFERRDLRQLRKLARRLRPIRRYSLDPVIVAMLQCDTRKHLRLLRELDHVTRRR